MNTFILFQFILNSFIGPDSSAYILTPIEIKEILGDNYHLEESSEFTHANRQEFKSNYIAAKNNFPEVDNVKLHYMYEFFHNGDEASIEINKFISSNKNNAGFKVINIDGKLGFVNSDNRNFCTVLIANSHHLIRLKVNRLGNPNQVKQVEKIALKLIARL
jgi:hypothetical protein